MRQRVCAMKGDSVKRFLVLGVAVAAIAAVPATSAFAANPHQLPNRDITCTEVQLASGPAVSCSGTIAGLGSADAVDIVIDASLACGTKPGNNQPRGHLQGTIEDVPVRSGRVDFENVTTDAASCPPGLVPTVGDFATISVFDSDTGEELFSTTVRIT
jgi:hypothetical protein